MTNSSVCKPFFINDLQVSMQENCDYRVYSKKNGKMKLVKDLENSHAYVYLDSKERKKLNEKDVDILRNDGVKKVYLYRQVLGSLECEHIDVIKITKKEKDKPYSVDFWVYFVMIVVTIVLFLFIFFYYKASSHSNDAGSVKDTIYINKSNNTSTRSSNLTIKL